MPESASSAAASFVSISSPDSRSSIRRSSIREPRSHHALHRPAARTPAREPPGRGAAPGRATGIRRTGAPRASRPRRRAPRERRGRPDADAAFHVQTTPGCRPAGTHARVNPCNARASAEIPPSRRSARRAPRPAASVARFPHTRAPRRVLSRTRRRPRPHAAAAVDPRTGSGAARRDRTHPSARGCRARGRGSSDDPGWRYHRTER